MGIKLPKKFDVASADFLGSGDKHCMYLNYFYANDIPGNEDVKFEYFKEILNGSDELLDLLESEGIAQPESATMVNCPGGFFDSMSEDQAKRFYEIVKPLIPTK